MVASFRRAGWVALFALLAAGSVRGQSVEYSDAFDGPDGERPGGWTIQGATDDAYWQRRQGQLHTGNGDDYEPGLTWAVLDQPGSKDWNNYTVGVDFRMTQDRGNVAIAARWKDSRSFYYATLEALRRANDSGITTQIQIFKMSGGKAQSLALGNAQQGLILPRFHSNTAGGNPIRFELQVNGTSLRAYVNGNEMLEATDSEFATGTVALGQEYNEVYFDNLRVSGTFDPGASVPIGAAPAGGATQAWRLLVLDHKTKAFATNSAADLRDYPTETVAEPDGSYSVYAGPYPTLAAAAAAATQLQAEGFLLADSAPRSYTPGGTPPPASTPAPAATPDLPEPPPQVDPVVAKQKKMDELSRAAGELEASGNLNGALDLWYNVKGMADGGTAMWQTSDENIRRLNREIANRQPAHEGGDGGGGGLPIGAILGGIGALVVVGGVIVFVMKKKGSAPAAAPRAAAPAAAKQTSQSAAAAAAALAALPPPTARGPKAEPTPRVQAPGPVLEVGPEARIRPGTVSPAPGPHREPTPRAPQPPMSIPRAEPTPRAPRPEPTPRPPQAAPPAPPRKPTEESGVKLDFLFDGPPEQPKTPAREDTADFFEPPAPDTHTPLPAEPTPPMASMAPAGGEQMFYAQDFEDEAVGASPANWKGDYEYASLKVHGEGVNGGARCLRFEKKNGVGSAYYSCRFPNASGRIGVEFDMRCDDKNKYLLGFYIEKDEDFRQSIHTIVHRTNSTSKPTLRLQNEACNYDFGRWTHIRFEIDLPRHIVDGYVDEKPIAMGTRLNNCPKYVNTLSIRDNLATAGVLLIDNIRIYRL